MMRKYPLDPPITNHERLALALRSLRREKGVTQAALATRAGVARRTVTNAEGAANVGIRELCHMVNTLGYDLVLRPRQTVVFEDLRQMFREDDDE
ncbi:MAG: helix-turn-helix domain-containing protein [Acidiferrobacter sp.]